MPRIKIYTPQTQANYNPGISIPQTRVPRNLLGPDPDDMTIGKRAKARAIGTRAEAQGHLARAYGSLAQSYDHLDQIGNSIANMGNNLIKSFMVANTQKAISSGSRKLAELVESYETRDDFEAFRDDYKAKSEEIKKELSGGLIGPFLGKFNAAYDSDALRGYNQVRALSAKRLLEHNEGALTQVQNDTEQAITHAPNLDERKRYAKRYIDELDHARQTRMITPKQYEVRVEKINDLVAVTEIRDRIERDPIGTYNEIAQGKPTNPEIAQVWKYLETSEQKVLKGEAKTAASLQEKKNEDNQVILAEEHLKPPLGWTVDNLTEAIQALNQPELLSHIGIANPAVATRVKTHLKSLRSDIEYQANKIKARAQETELTAIEEAMEKGDLGAASLLVDGSKALSRSTKSRYRRSIKATRKARQTAFDKARKEQTKARKALTKETLQFYIESRLGDPRYDQEALKDDMRIWVNQGHLPQKMETRYLKQMKRNEGEPLTHSYLSDADSLARKAIGKADDATEQLAVFRNALLTELNQRGVKKTSLEVVKVAKEMLEEGVIGIKPGLIWGRNDVVDFKFKSPTRRFLDDKSDSIPDEELKGQPEAEAIIDRYGLDSYEAAKKTVEEAGVPLTVNNLKFAIERYLKTEELQGFQDITGE